MERRNRETKDERYKQKIKPKIIDLNPTLSVTILNVNGLNISCKGYSLIDQTRKQD